MAQPLMNPAVRSRITQSIIAKTRQAQSDADSVTLAKARAQKTAPAAEGAKPTAYIVGATRVVGIDSGAMELRAGRRLDAVDDASLLGTLKRQCDDLELLPVFDTPRDQNIQDGSISEQLNYRGAA